MQEQDGVCWSIAHAHASNLATDTRSVEMNTAFRILASGKILLESWRAHASSEHDEHEYDDGGEDTHRALPVHFQQSHLKI